MLNVYILQLLSLREPSGNTALVVMRTPNSQTSVYKYCPPSNEIRVLWRNDGLQD